MLENQQKIFTRKLRDDFSSPKLSKHRVKIEIEKTWSEKRERKRGRKRETFPGRPEIFPRKYLLRPIDFRSGNDQYIR